VADGSCSLVEDVVCVLYTDMESIKHRTFTKYVNKMSIIMYL
jgi:hypothetical protein